MHLIIPLNCKDRNSSHYSKLFGLESRKDMLGGIGNIKVGKHGMMIDKVIYTISSTSRLLIEFNLFNVLERECI